MSFLDKSEPPRSGRSRRSKREWTIAPPPVYSGAEVEGIRVLEELPGALGLLLFQRLRDVLLWVATSPRRDREGLFADSEASGSLPEWQSEHPHDASIGAALQVLNSLVLRPAETDARAVSTACAAVVEWASIRGHGVTEAEFARAAAIVSPADPELAFAAGRAARRLALYEPAVEWFRRSIGLARKAGDDAAYAAAYLGWGVLEDQRGRRDRARSRFVKAWRAAVRGSFPALAAAARHNMIPLSVPDRPFEEGQAHALAAFKYYRRRPELARLAADTASFWTWHGYFSAALPVLEACLPLIERLADRLQVLANVARTAAVVGDSARFHAAWGEVERQSRQLSGELLPWVLIDLAHGARTLGHRRAAQDLSEKAIECARKRGESGALDSAAALQRELHDGTPSADRDREPPETVVTFARRLIERLEERTPPP